MIHQHFALVPSQTVLENVMVGQEEQRAGFLRMAEARARLLKLEERFGLDVDPDAHVWSLSVGEQQRVEILKALYREPRVLIMDEPTAVLTPPEVEDLFKMLRTFAAAGNAVVFISHKLNEVMDISDRVVVLRNGEVAAEAVTRETTRDKLAELMVGRKLVAQLERQDWPAAEPILEIAGLSARNDKNLTAFEDINLVVHSGEIVGVAGVSGNGQRELAEVLFGTRRPGAGSMKLAGVSLRPGRPRAALDAGMARIPEDRMTTGLLTELSVEDNLILENHAGPEFQRHGLLDHRKIHRHCDRLIDEYRIKTTDRDMPARCLSGGNAQKVILARELSFRPGLILAAQPTRGLDVGATEDIHRKLLAERERGAAILLISEDLDEIFALSDRIVVMYEGALIGETPAEKADRTQIGLWMSGVKS